MQTHVFDANLLYVILKVDEISCLKLAQRMQGMAHDIQLMLPPEVKAEVPEIKKGETPKLILKSCDKQLVGQVAAKIRSFRKPEPYKGKGIKFVGEQLRRKAGKTAAAK